MSITRKTNRRVPVNSQKSFAFKQELRIGGEIAAALPQFKSQSEVAAKLGISQQMVSRIERRALFKIRNLLLSRKEVVANRLPC